jgi:hypothetical protein
MKRKTLTTAVLAGLTGIAGMASVANAVNVNPDGLGQVLLFPYYTARGGNSTLISIVNTTEFAKGVKVRFIEAMNSREVLDFNLYMSPFDVWTAAVIPDADGAKMVTTDTSCTVPYFQGGVLGNVGEQEFLTFQYAAPGRSDRGPQGRERTMSGYIEIIEMATFLDNSDTWKAIKHTSGDVPPVSGTGGSKGVCGLLQQRWLPPNGAWLSDPLLDAREGGVQIPATGGLTGSASIVNVANGTMISYNATSIDGFWLAGASHTNPGSLLPGLSSGTGFEAFVFNNGQLVNLDYSTAIGLGLNSVLAINATISLEALLNEYVLESGLNAATEWVLTFPTKRYHSDAAPGNPEGVGLAVGAKDARPPFTETWRVANNAISNLPCEEQTFRVWNREEREPDDEPGRIIVSPPPPPGVTPTFELCREANVVRFSNDESLPGATEILAEPRREDAFAKLGYVNFDLPSDFENGWVRFDFGGYSSLGDANGRTVLGLPVIGFQATRIENGTLAGGTVLSNYGASFQHRGSRAFGVTQ